MATQYGGAFLRGANANNYAANATNCYNRVLNFWFNDVPLLQWRYYYGTFDDILFNSTRAVTVGTNAAMTCYDAIENVAIFTQNKIKLFPDLTSLLMAFF